MNDVLVLEIQNKADYEKTIRLFEKRYILIFKKEQEPSTYPCAMLQTCGSLYSDKERVVTFDYNTIFAKNYTMDCKEYAGFVPLNLLISENLDFFQVCANDLWANENCKLCNRKKCNVFDRIHSFENEPVNPISVKGLVEYIGLEQFGSSINTNFLNILRLKNKCNSFIKKEKNSNTELLFKPTKMAGIDKTYIDSKYYPLFREWWIDNYEKMIKQFGDYIWLYPFNFLDSSILHLNICSRILTIYKPQKGQMK